MGNELASLFYQFVITTLPDLLSVKQTPEEALAELGKAWEETRRTKIEDRTDEVAENRAEVDAKLAGRKKG